MRFIRTDSKGEVTLRIEGQLDANTTSDIRPTLDDVVANRPMMVIVDLSGLGMIDSSGIGAIVSLFKRVRAYGGDMRLIGTQGQPLAIFKLLRLDRVFAI